ncbi:MAG: PAS domain-containing protein [Methylocystis sp.]|uniref:PAS domain-containing protein n=1 Tax=Methylocystis sp. TaxID=1911079 RepID=UPI003DA647AD
MDERRRLDSQKQVFLENALRENDLVLQMALESGGIGIHVWEPQTGELVWDDRVRAQWGLRPGAHVDYEIFMQGVHPMDRAAVEDAVERALDPQNGGYYQAEYRVVGIEDRIERWIVATGRVLFSEKKAARLIAPRRMSQRKGGLRRNCSIAKHCFGRFSKRQTQRWRK